MANDGVKGGVAGAITGAAVPIATSYVQPKKEDVAAAAKILQDFPVASSLPGGDMLSINNSSKTSPMSTAANVSAAGLSGLGAGALGTFIPPTLDAPQVIAKHLKSNKFSLSPLKALFVRLYTLFGDGNFNRFIIECSSKEEAKGSTTGESKVILIPAEHRNITKSPSLATEIAKNFN